MEKLLMIAAPLGERLRRRKETVAVSESSAGGLVSAALLAQSGEAAWIATEGNAFNHATDRVADVEALSDTLRDGGWPIKERVEISASGRVRQTAFRADPVERLFLDADGQLVRRTVPGSFYEFITRHAKDDGSLDLAFDSANATGIFAMTRAA